MHAEVFNWTKDAIDNWRQDKNNSPYKVLEIGSLDINGSIRSIFSDAESYLGIDMQEGPGVDLVTNAATFITDELVDVIVCCEVFEHTGEWPQILETSYKNLNTNGILIGTAAGEGRAPHSAIDENPIRDWEYYANVKANELRTVLEANNFKNIIINNLNADIRWIAIKI